MRGRLLAVVVAAFVVVGVGASSASAAPTARAGQTTLLGGLSDLLCPVTTTVADLTAPVPVVNSLTGGLNSLICNLRLLELRVRTEYSPPGGGAPIIRETPAIAELPALVNVDNDVAPELVVSVTAITPSAITVRVQKAPGAEANLPVQVELIAHDPSNINSDNRIAFGYDSRPSSVPTDWSATLGVLQTSNPTHLSLAVATKGAGSGLALLGELFKLNPDNTRTPSVKGRLGFSPVPATNGYDLTLGSSSQTVNVTSSQSTAITGQVQLFDGSHEQRINANLTDVPSSTTVKVDSLGADKRKVTYGASGTLGSLSATYQDLTGTTLNSKAVVNADHLPTGLALEQTGPRSGSLATSGGSIGQLEVGFANGEPVLPAAGSGVRVVSGGGLSSLAARLSGLQAATFDATGPYALDLRSATQPFRVLVEDHDANRTVDAHINDLPAHVNLTLDPNAGNVTYNAFGESIDEITLGVDDDTPLFSRVTHIAGTLKTIPPAFALHFGTAGGGAQLTLDHPIGQVDVLASDGSTLTAPSDSGIVYRDTPSQYAIYTKVFGPQSVSFTPDPIAASVQTAGGHVFSLDGKLQSSPADTPVTINGEIDKLPSLVSLGVTSDASGTTATYNASARIDRIEATVKGLSLLPRAKVLYAKVLGLPSALTVKVPKSGPLATFATSGGAVDNVEFQALDSDTHETFRAPDGSFSPNNDGLTYLDIPGRFAIAAKVSGLRGGSATIDPSPVFGLDVDPAKSKPFGIAVHKQATDADPMKFLEGEFDKPGAHMTFTMQSDPTRFSYDGDAGIGSIFVRTNFADTVPLITAKVDSVPKHLAFCVHTGDGTECVRPRGGDAPEDTERSAVVDIDDNGTSTVPLVANAVVCLVLTDACVNQPLGVAPPDAGNNTTDKYVAVVNLALRNLMFDIHATNCGLLFCGHLGIDTRNQNLTGDMFYNDPTVSSLLDNVHAHIHFPNGFHTGPGNGDQGFANYRVTRWSNEAIATGSKDESYGTVTCPAGTLIDAIVDPLGGGSGTAPGNIAPDYFC